MKATVTRYPSCTLQGTIWALVGGDPELLVGTLVDTVPSSGNCFMSLAVAEVAELLPHPLFTVWFLQTVAECSGAVASGAHSTVGDNGLVTSIHVFVGEDHQKSSPNTFS